jgi:hypothetical protein
LTRNARDEPLSDNGYVMNTHAELFGKISFQPILLAMLALILFATAFRRTFRIAASVNLVWIAAGVAVFGIDRAMLSFNPLLRNTLVIWAALFFVVFSVCAAVWIRERSAESKLSTITNYRSASGSPRQQQS